MMTGKPMTGDARYAALEAQSEARFREVFGRLERVEISAGEARDIGREVLTILREQNALDRIAEVRSEVTNKVESLRQDVVHAIDLARKHVDGVAAALDDQIGSLNARIDRLERLKERGAGMAVGIKVAIEAGKVIVAAGGGAVLVKALGG